VDEPPREQHTPYRTMREFADDERPRERLLRHGPAVLGDAELIAIVLGSGIRGENVMDLARRLVESEGGLDGLVRADVQSLQRARGLGPAKAAQLAAAIELGRRLQQLDPDARPVLARPEAIFAFMAPRLLGRPKEELHVLALDAGNRLLGAPMRVPGGVNMVPVRTAEVFREAIVQHATSVVLVHNHPSGDPRPSRPDVAITRDLIAAGELLQIAVHDHIVVGHGKYVSMKRDGYAFRGKRE